ncbi:J domain-containing protein [Amycolatopsis sp. NBC_01307]|uniref:J domain-containing protein n=1 Tax=Amycolatopsis sp. NBC_01307 TaxID=2903561 RepID=UPI002E0EF829|nr:J domain-containing protein [Amycolatopsis sp. NBC_01307]
MKQNHYEVLGVAQDATFSEIRSAYRQWVKVNRPDLSPSKHVRAEFVCIKEAYYVLRDAGRRALFDNDSDDLSSDESRRTSSRTEWPTAPPSTYRESPSESHHEERRHGSTEEQYSEVFEDEDVYDEPTYTDNLSDSKPPSLTKHALTQGFWCLFWFGLAVGCFYMPDVVTRPFREASNKGEVIAPLGAGIVGLLFYVASLVCALVGIAQLFNTRSRD